MAVINGNLLVVSSGGNAYGCQTSGTLNFDSDMLETTCKGSAPNRTYIPGLLNGTVDVGGFYDPSATEGVSEIYSDITNGTLLSVRFGQTGSGETYYQADAYVSNLSITGDINDPANYSATLQFTGAISEGSVT